MENIKETKIAKIARLIGFVFIFISFIGVGFLIYTNHLHNKEVFKFEDKLYALSTTEFLLEKYEMDNEYKDLEFIDPLLKTKGIKILSKDGKITDFDKSYVYFEGDKLMFEFSEELYKSEKRFIIFGYVCLVGLSILVLVNVMVIRNSNRFLKMQTLVRKQRSMFNMLKEHLNK